MSEGQPSIWEPGTRVVSAVRPQTYQVEETLYATTEGQKTFTLSVFTYEPYTGTLRVYVNGSRVVGILETSETTFSLPVGVAKGSKVFVEALLEEISATDQWANQLRADLAEASDQKGSELVGYISSGEDATARTVQDKLRETVSAFDYLTAEQIDEVISYSFLTDLTTPLQQAIDQAFADNKDLFVPAGGYLVTGLYLPGRVSGSTDDRGKAFRFFGQGTGEPFVISSPKGTVIKSETDVPVLQDYLDGATDGNGQVTVDHIRFDGTSTTPVVQLRSFYGLSEFHHCVIYQRGVGDGLLLGWGATIHCHENYVMNKDWATPDLGTSRVGTGISYIPTADNGLVTISKCTSRGFNTGFQLAGGAGRAYAATIDKCECSYTYNGVLVQDNADKCRITGCYFEGAEGGVGINNLGNYTTISGNLIFPGYATAIQDLGTLNKGTTISENVIGLGAVEDSKGVVIQSSAFFGGYNKNVVNNSIAYTVGTAGVKGIQLAGTTPRVTVMGNSFDPRGAWTGANSAKFDYQTTGGVFGVITKEQGDFEIPVLAQGAISLFVSDPLTEDDVSAGMLTIADGSCFVLSATVPTVIQRFSSNVLQGRFVVFRTTNANTTIQQTAYIQTAGGASFTGPGTITFLMVDVAGSCYAYEICRTVF